VVKVQRIHPEHVAVEQGRPVGFKRQGAVVLFTDCPSEKFTFAPGWR